MSQLLLDKDRPLHKAQPGDNLSAVARARTLTVLTRLDGNRKRSVVDFLYESRLIRKNCKDLGDWPLKQANLIEADLVKAHLRGADLRHARLRKANLSEADLLEADLSGADLSNANLQGATGVTSQGLERAYSLEGTIMPDGSKHP
jgi:Pentapeptide repeats (8 copies)